MGPGTVIPVGSVRWKTVKRCAKGRWCKHLVRLVGAILLVGLLMLPGCRGTPTEQTPSRGTPPAVPHRANFLAQVELAEIINDEDLSELYREMAAQEATLPETLNDALEEVQCETGVNLKDFDDAIVFADTLSLVEVVESQPYDASLAYWGVLIQGELDESSFIDSVEASTGRELVRSYYQDLTIYSVDHTAKEVVVFSMAFPIGGQMVIGADRAVRDVIDVAAGLEEPISGTVYDLYCQLGDALIKLASSVPESLTQEIPAEIDVGPVSLSLLCFREIRYATAVIVENEAIIDAELCLLFCNEDSAKEGQSLLWIGSKFGKSAVPDPAVGELLSRAQVSGSGTSVSLTLALATSEIEELASTLLQQGRR